MGSRHTGQTEPPLALKIDGVGALKLAKKAKILGAGNSKWTIANAMHELRSVNRTLGKRRQHDKGNTATLKFVDIFEPKLQFMFSLHVSIDS